MTNEEKFEGFKKAMIDENEKKYGRELREKYTDEQIDYSNNQIKNMTSEQYEQLEKLTAEVNTAIKKAYDTKNPNSEEAKKAVELHKTWLMFFWKSYSKEAHIGLGEMYVADERFKAYYEKIAPNCAEFLCQAIKIHSR